MKGIALIIGIDDYAHPDVFKKLHSAVKDANDFAQKLTELKYDVNVITDGDDNEVFAYYGDFIEKLNKCKYDVAIFYFAGHGKQINRYDCLILKNIENTEHGGIPAMKSHSIKVQEVIDDMRAANDQINIIIVDACRHNMDDRGQSLINKNTTPITIPYQTFISYSTSPGTGAKDGREGENSIFAKSLLSHICEENLPVELLFKEVRKEMNAKELTQLSWEYSCLINDFCFNHGQTNPYYDAPYKEDSFKYGMMAINPNDENSIISLLKSGNDTLFDKSIKLLIAKRGELDDNILFISGRLICHNAAIGISSCLNYLNAPNLVRLICRNGINHLLRGVFYELYFDEDDKVRDRILGDVEFLTCIERLRSLIQDKESSKFIAKYLIPYKDKFHYTIGHQTNVDVYVETEELDYIDIKGNTIEVITDVIFVDSDVSVDLKDAADKELMDRNELREYLIQKICVPRQSLRLNSLNEDSVFIRFYFDSLETELEEWFRNNTPSEVDCLSSLSYVEEVYNIRIKNIDDNTDDTIEMNGVCEVTVHLEFDHDDAGSQSFECSFCCSLEKETDGKYHIMSESVRAHVDTEPYYQ